MRFYNQPHQFYRGIDLHARTLYLGVLDQACGCNRFLKATGVVRSRGINW